MDWLRWAVTGAFLAIAGYCVVRLVAARRVPAAYPGRYRAVDMAHVLMGVGMAAMASPVGGPLSMAGWQVVFLLLAAWFVGTWWTERRTTDRWHGGWHGNGLHHALAAAAMLYMLLAMPMPHGGHHGAPWLPGSTASGMAIPLLGWALVAYFAGSAVLLAMASLKPAQSAPAGLPAVLATARVTASCQAAMALGNGYLLVAML